MKTLFNNLTLIQKSILIAILITFSIFLITLPLIVIDLMEVAFGILLGGLGCILSLCLFTIKEKTLNDHTLMIVTIINIVVMSLIHIAVIILAACLYYLLDLHIFNVWATFASSFIGLISLIISSLITKKE